MRQSQFKITKASYIPEVLRFRLRVFNICKIYFDNNLGEMTRMNIYKVTKTLNWILSNDDIIELYEGLKIALKED